MIDTPYLDSYSFTVTTTKGRNNMKKKILSFTLALGLLSALSVPTGVFAEDDPSGDGTVSGNDPEPAAETLHDETVEGQTAATEQSSVSLGDGSFTLQLKDIPEGVEVTEIAVNWEISSSGNTFTVTPVFTAKLSDGTEKTGSAADFAGVKWAPLKMVFTVDLPDGPVTIKHVGDDGSEKATVQSEAKGGKVEYNNEAGFSTFTITPVEEKPAEETKPTEETKPAEETKPVAETKPAAPSCAANDRNCDGVVSCEEAYGAGYYWNENVKACVTGAPAASNGKMFVPATADKD